MMQKPAANALTVHRDAERNVYEKQRAIAADLARPLAIIDDAGNAIAVTHPLPDIRQHEDGE